MQADPAYPHLAPVIASCPDQAGPLLTAYRDLSLSVGWVGLRALELSGTGWAVLIGRRRAEHTSALRPSSLRAIFNALAALARDTASLPPADPPLAPGIDELRAAAAARRETGAGAETAESVETVGPVEPAPPTAAGSPPAAHPALDADTLYLAITTPDSTVVYYKLARGIRKPADVADEL